MSMAHKFSSSRDISCRITVESRPSSRTMFGWPEGHVLSSNEGDDKHFVSQGREESLSETNDHTNFTSSNGSWLVRHFAIQIFGQEIKVAKTVFSNFSLRPPWKWFPWKRSSKG